MTAAGYNVSTQEFSFLFVGDASQPILERVSAPPRSFVNGPEFQTMNYSGSGDVTAPLVAVDLNLANPFASTSGCEAADYAGFPAGSIALVQRGTCTFRIKAEVAAAGGAAGV